MKKFALTSLAIVVVGLSGLFAFAGVKTPDQLGKDIAQQYIDSSLVDENWHSSHPYIAADYTYVTDSDAPAYKEYKVSCDDKPNCGWIVVNVDGDDVSIPVASTDGSANFELLNAKLDVKQKQERFKGRSDKRKLYYFSPFEQAVEDENGQVESLTPSNAVIKSHADLSDRIGAVKNMKKSDVFKKKRKELQSSGQTSFARDSWLRLPLSYAAGSTTVPDTFVPGASTVNCGSRIPCYKFDAPYTYSTGTCKFGCVPTALAMIYGYHDRQGTYPNLVTGTAKDYIDDATTDASITSMINSIRTSVGTTCVGGEGQTPASSAALGIAYAKAKGYTAAVASYETGATGLMLNSIKAEVNASRPVLV
jgi:hypothetical protein